ncbi:MAG: cation:proton antiporter [Gemmatimonadales bacterium]
MTPLATGVAIGVAVPWAANRLEGSRWFGAHESYRSLAGFSIALLVLSLAHLAKANEFLAAFAAGVTVISLRPEISKEFGLLVESLANLLKFAGLLIFGALLSPALLHGMAAGDYLFALLAVVAVRPIVLSLALVGSPMPPRDRIVAAVFGPKGFASVLYAVLVLRAGVPSAGRLFDLAAMVITVSIVLFSSTDVLAARWLTRDRPPRADSGEASDSGGASGPGE